jgi:hypothetical protein
MAAKFQFMFCDDIARLLPACFRAFKLQPNSAACYCAVERVSKSIVEILEYTWLDSQYNLPWQ